MNNLLENVLRVMKVRYVSNGGCNQTPDVADGCRISEEWHEFIDENGVSVVTDPR
jgi:hypothetical protein